MKRLIPCLNIIFFLTAFVFMFNLMMCGVALADRTSELDASSERIADGVISYAKKDARIRNSLKTYNDKVVIEGSQNLKSDNLISNNKVVQQKFTGEVGKDKDMKLHYLFQPVSLESLLKEYEAQWKKEAKNYKNTSNFRFTQRDYTVTLQLTAKDGDKVLKQLKKSFHNQMDSTLEYKVPENATQIFVTISMNEKIYASDKSNPNKVVRNNQKNITVNLKPVKKIVDPESGDISLIYLGGGLFVLLIGGAAIFFYSGGVGGAAAGAAGAGAEPPVPPEPEPPVSPEPEEFLYTDPAGFQTLYVKDPGTGQWYNYEDYNKGYRVPVDMDKFEGYDAQRRKDVSWNQKQMTKLENRETSFDNELKQDYQDMLDREKQIRQETQKDLYALKTGTFGMSDAERDAFMKNRQKGYEADAKKAANRAKNWDRAVKTAEVVQIAADIGVDTLAIVTAPVGGGFVADAYAVTKNIAGSTMDGMVTPGRTFLGGLAEGVTKAGIDVAQNHSLTKWQKLASYVGGEGLKGGIEAGIQGESFVKGAFKGAFKGATKLGVEKVADGISKAASKTNFGKFKNHYKEITEVYSKDISQKSVNALRQMNYEKFAAKETGNLWKNGITQGMGKNLGPKMFD